MRYEQFTARMRMARGKLTRNEEDLTTIFVSGTPELIEFALEKKLMGVKNIAYIAELPQYEQKKFTDWMASKNWKATKNELELYATSNNWSQK